MTASGASRRVRRVADGAASRGRPAGSAPCENSVLRMKEFLRMKIRRLISTIALLVTACGAAAAQTAAGSYQFALEDGRTKYVKFEAATEKDGGAAGSMFFSDDAPITYQDTDGAGDPVETYPGFYFSAEFDDMQVSENKAVI